VHAGAVGAGQQLTVGSRLQYRFENGWLVCEIHKAIPGVSGCRYDLNCENQQIVLGAWLRACEHGTEACEHGTEKQWVLWQADSSIAGDPAYAVASASDDERIMSAPAAGSDIMGAYVKERLANKKKEHVYINFLSPYDFLGAGSDREGHEIQEGYHQSQIRRVPICGTWLDMQRSHQPRAIRNARPLFFHRAFGIRAMIRAMIPRGPHTFLATPR
jgi:hypothetical protein